MKYLFLSFALCLLAAMSATSASAAVAPDLVEYSHRFEQFPDTKGKDSESVRLQKLFDLFWEFTMHASPEFATAVGYPGLNDRWSDASFEAIAFGRALSPKILQALDSMD